MEQLSGLDAAFVYFEAAGAAHVTFFGTYDPSTAPDGGVTFDDVVSHIGARLGADRHMRSVLAHVPLDLDHPYWVRDENFDLSRHVHHLTLPSRGGWSQLCEAVSDIHAAPMDLSRPPWECFFIDGLGQIPNASNAAFAVCFKMHHSAVDGATGLGMVGALHDLTSEPPEPQADDWVAEHRPSALNLVVRTALSYTRRQMKLLAASRHGIPLLGRLPGALTRLAPAPQGVERGLFGSAPRTPLNERSDSSRNFDARDYDLSAVLAARALVPGATVNDVLLTGIGGALRRYLSSKGELPDSSLVTVIAISEHTDDAEGTNQIAVARVTLGTDIANPVGRLRAVYESSAESKAFVESVGPKALMGIAEYVPGGLLVPLIRFARAADLGKYYPSWWIANTYVTAMRAPEVPIYLRGARLLGGYSFSPFSQGNGLMHNVITYCGRVFVSLNGCPAVLPDIEFYADCVDASFAELLAEV